MSINGIFRSFYSNKGAYLFLIFAILITSALRAQANLPGYDELNVELSIPQKGMVEIPVAIRNNNAFIPVQEFFNILQLKNVEISTGIIGFIIHPDSTYHINYQKKEINYRNKTYEITESDYIQSSFGNYLRSDLFGSIFGLNAEFSFRNLSLKLVTDKELPIIKEMRLQKMRENLNKVKGIISPDTILPQRRPFFKPGTLDWGIITTQQSDLKNDNRLMLGLGTMFLGGETNLMLNYSSRIPFESRNQFYQWRYVDNDKSFVKQITAGRIFTRSTSSLFAPVSGVQISNSPMQNRRSFGSYLLNDYTDPRWTVELYVNNVLVDFTQADASGFYSFEVPLMYGNTSVSLRFYGPWGEERVEDRVINIPYNFVPKKELEYTFSAGIVENENWNRFSRLTASYGISNAITLGLGAEYLSEVESGEVMPFLNTSIRFATNFLFTGEYMYGVKAEGLLSYRTPKNFQVDFNYIKYNENQKAINFNYLEERKISLSAPIRSNNFSVFSRFSINQIILPSTKFTTAQLLLSGALMGISTNLTTYGMYNDRVERPTIYSSLSQTYKLPNKFLFSPQIQYDFTEKQLNNLILELERPIFSQGFLNVAYEHNFLRTAHIFEIGLRYSFNFSQTSATSRIGNRNSSFVQSARGSLMLDDNYGYIMASNRTAMSKAALTIIPFLDYNHNGVKDEMEPGVSGLELRNRMGKLTYNSDRTILRITELQPYIDVLLEIDPISLDNIAWKIINPKIMIQTIPNQFQEVHVPVVVMGEVSGMVYLKNDKNTEGIGRILVNILDKNNEIVSKVLTEGDGYFTFLGLKPGNYKAIIDPEQLKIIGYTASPASITFTIETDEFGDIVDDLEFVLEAKNKNSQE